MSRHVKNDLLFAAKKELPMKQIITTLAVLSVLSGATATTAIAHGPDKSVASNPPAAPYQKVSDLVPLPAFIPGIGELFVDPATLPAGPFVAYNRSGQLVSTIYMIPIADLNPDKNFDNLAVPGRLVDHTDIYYNAGHPGVNQPHAHIVLWHIPVASESSVAK